MKKSLLLLFMLLMVLSLVLTGCGASEEPAGGEAAGTPAVEEEVAESKTPAEMTADELPTITIAATPYSGNVLHFIAAERGLYEEAGVNVEIAFINGFSEAMESLNAGHVQMVTTYGTGGPMQLAATGEDVSIIGGYMLTGCMPVMAKEGTEWNGPEDFDGKTITTRGGGGSGSFPIQYSMVEAGLDLANTTFLHNIDQTVALEMVAKGEADFAAGTTGIHTQAKAYGLEVVCFLSDLLPEYSCCRVGAKTDWVFDDGVNYEATVRCFSAWLRAMEILQAEPQFAADVTVANTELSQEYVENFEFDTDHWKVVLDPHYKAVKRAWLFMDEMGILEGETDEDRMNEVFDCTLYKEALDRNTEMYPDSAEFYQKYQDYFYEVNAEYLELMNLDI